jgi:hypothetical protein
VATCPIEIAVGFAAPGPASFTVLLAWFDHRVLQLPTSIPADVRELRA